jgi:hypothetical protein
MCGVTSRRKSRTCFRSVRSTTLYQVMCRRTPAAKKELAQLFRGSKRLPHCSLRSARNNSSKLMALRSTAKAFRLRRYGKPHSVKMSANHKVEGRTSSAQSGRLAWSCHDTVALMRATFRVSRHGHLQTLAHSAQSRFKVRRPEAFQNVPQGG